MSEISVEGICLCGTSEVKFVFIIGSTYTNAVVPSKSFDERMYGTLVFVLPKYYSGAMSRSVKMMFLYASQL
jgi:hypothetical protein